jgi:hypothetical protein
MEWYVQVGVASTLVTVAIISFMVLSDFLGFGDSKFKVDGRVSIVYDLRSECSSNPSIDCIVDWRL